MSKPRTATIDNLPPCKVTKFRALLGHRAGVGWSFSVQWGPVVDGKRDLATLRRDMCTPVARLLSTSPSDTPVLVRITGKSGWAYVVGVAEVVGFATYAVTADLVGVGPLKAQRRVGNG